LSFSHATLTHKSLTPSPFRLLSTCGLNSCDRVAHHLSEFSSHVRPLFMCDRPSPLYTWVGFPSTWFSFPLPSPLYTWVGFPSTWFSFPLPSPLYTWVGFPSTWFSFPLPSPLCSQVKFLLTWFPLTSMWHRSTVPSVKL
jgi:hypothetical protein